MNNVSSLTFSDLGLERPYNNYETLNESANGISSDASEYDKSDRTTSNAYNSSFKHGLLWSYNQTIAQEAEGSGESGSGGGGESGSGGDGSNSGSGSSGSGSGSGNSGTGSGNASGNDVNVRDIVHVEVEFGGGGCTGPRDR